MPARRPAPNLRPTERRRPGPDPQRRAHRPPDPDGLDGGASVAGPLTLPARVAVVRETATSDDGLVVATVDAHGQLVDLVLDPRIHHAAPDALGRTIVDTVRRAVVGADRQLSDLTAATTEPRRRPYDGAGGSPTPTATGDPAFDPLLRELDRLAAGPDPAIGQSRWPHREAPPGDARTRD
ncbi:YbaB/EbfC family nucleoid-associated protein [Plantactinospora sonchi]|uniref:YbaB/EbfC family nucleoid-associated protein n=1 Tax=Plantactinospora sonchi TaxID=1544735 RepID=A0ABU7RPM1_9ACTN